jgi:putative membrane protein
MIQVEDVEPVAPVPNTANLPGAAPDRSGSPFIQIETLDDAGLVSPRPDASETQAPSDRDRLRPDARRGHNWLVWLALTGVFGLISVGLAEWILDLLQRLPILGGPAAVAAIALGGAVLGLTLLEVLALRRLRDVEQIRSAWDGADGERLRRLILRVGRDMGNTAGARRAADLVDDAGPDAARRLLSREVLAESDRQVSAAVAKAARHGAVIVAASPSPFIDAVLLLGIAMRLLRQIAVVYGYRPGTLALRSLAISAWRDAGAIVLADALAQAATQSASETAERTGEAMKTMGAAATTSGIGALVGVPLAAAGVGLSMAGRALGPAGGPVGAGAAAAWRLYRFGLIVLVSARPLPFDEAELRDLRARTRANIFRVEWASDAREVDGPS